jgi:hypothetical protein
MSAENENAESSENLERFEAVDSGPPKIIEGCADGLWWTDSKTERDGQVAVHFRYVPVDWVVYPESLVRYLRRFEDAEERPEPMASEVWNVLSELLYNEPEQVDELMEIRVEAETPLDGYSVKIGDIKTE